ncbi:hypothetical protein N7492_000899 [Penicillium capsulatum]|uniref:Uncharacterized protein n=1 Tax=Penicillium capsulatum TaxID=69766 RepID=A0A9W9IQF9_9EURO|nr:hypothetical protein N7492_000899 [Penicillium capsulatum]KAJ6130043.1 hypothetical protein N7512_002823 [Penicillium capsulatum]
MEKQLHSVRQKPVTATEAMGRLVSKAKELIVLGCLSDNEKRRTADTIKILRRTQSASKRRKYKLFLCDLLEKTGPPSVLLCAIALGQVVIANMRQRDRHRLIELVENDTHFSHRTIQRLAARCQIPVSLESLNSNDLENMDNTHDWQERPAIPDTYEEQSLQAASQPTYEMNIGRQIELMWSKAPIDLIPQLGDFMKDAIESSYQWKMERAAGEPTTDCFVTIVPEDENADISINLRVGQRLGLQLLTLLKLRPLWSSLLGHLPP